MKYRSIQTHQTKDPQRQPTRSVVIIAALAAAGSIIAFAAARATPASGCGTAFSCQQGYDFQVVCRPAVSSTTFHCTTAGDAFGGTGYSSASTTDKCGSYKDCNNKPALCAAAIPGGACNQPE